MSSASSASPMRLFTTHGTVFYVEPSSGELRHGPFDGSPANATFVVDGPHGRILHDRSGDLSPIVYLADHCQSLNLVAGGAPPAAPTVLEVVPLYGAWVGLRGGGVFLCAEPDGRVTLSRNICRAGESFFVSAGPPSPQDGGSSRKTPSLSISCIETRDPRKAIAAIERTAQSIRADCLYWFSNSPYPKTLPGVEIVNVAIPPIGHFFEDTSRICLSLMPRVVTTDFNLTVQADGFAVNPQAWDDRFWDYDYVGAPWSWMQEGRIVGNGGFSLRSRKLYDALIALPVKWRLQDWVYDIRLGQRYNYVMTHTQEKCLPEDTIICRWYGDLLERRYGIKFCPPELANKFSVETVDASTKEWLGRSFGFHGPVAAPHYGVVL